jgi:hypothetical protein
MPRPLALEIANDLYSYPIEVDYVGLRKGDNGLELCAKVAFIHDSRPLVADIRYSLLYVVNLHSPHEQVPSGARVAIYHLSVGNHYVPQITTVSADYQLVGGRVLKAIWKKLYDERQNPAFRAPLEKLCEHYYALVVEWLADKRRSGIRVISTTDSQIVLVSTDRRGRRIRGTVLLDQNCSVSEVHTGVFLTQLDVTLEVDGQYADKPTFTIDFNHNDVTRTLRAGVAEAIVYHTYKSNA